MPIAVVTLLDMRQRGAWAPHSGGPLAGGPARMATRKQTQAAKRNVKKAQKAAAGHKTIAYLPADTRSALGKQGTAVAQRKRAGGASPKTRAELDEIARKRELPARSKVGRDELSRKLGEN